MVKLKLYNFLVKKEQQTKKKAVRIKTYCRREKGLREESRKGAKES
jgi:hypothetical protein